MNRLRFGVLGAWLVTSAVFGAAKPAFAAEPDSATRGAARKLGTSGVEAYQAGDYPSASEKLERAYAALKVPSLGLWSARALIKLNRWVEASERLVEVTRLDVSGDIAVQKAARSDAESELAALSPRIPSVTVDLKGPAPGDVTVTIDARPLASTLVGASVPIDPGKHTFRAQLGAQQTEETASFNEAESKHVLLALRAAEETAAPETAPAPLQRNEPAPATDSAPSASHTRRNVGLVTAAVGVVGLGAGTVFYFKAKGDNDDAKKICPTSDACTSGDISRHGDLVDSVKTERLVAYLAWGIGGAALVTGAVLYFTTPEAPSGASSARRLQLGVAPLPRGGYVGVLSGAF
jgi:hypothetical protein